jgi:hypothetical protein
MSRFHLAVGAALALAACASSPASSPPAAAPTAPAAGASAPLPYTAEQLRAASPVGRVMRYRVAQGGKAAIVSFRFTAATAEAATIETVTSDEAGAALGAPESATTPWAELAKHAAYPAATTSTEPAEIETPAGRVAATKYVVRQAHADGRPSVTIAYFTRDLAHAGPPVKLLLEVGGALVVDMTLLADEGVAR